MTLHVILGDGYMPTKELHAHLQDIRKKALADDDGFWFTIAGKPEPTDTDRALVKWLSTPDYDIYWDVIGDEDSIDKLYAHGPNLPQGVEDGHHGREADEAGQGRWRGRGGRTG